MDRQQQRYMPPTKWGHKKDQNKWQWNSIPTKLFIKKDRQEEKFKPVQALSMVNDSIYQVTVNGCDSQDSEFKILIREQ